MIGDHHLHHVVALERRALLGTDADLYRAHQANEHRRAIRRRPVTIERLARAVAGRMRMPETISAAAPVAGT